MWTLTVMLTVGCALANCVPVGPVEQACDCCASEGQQVGDFTVATVVTLPAPSVPPVSYAPALELLNPTDGLFQYALRHTTRFTPAGVPRYLLTATLLI